MNSSLHESFMREAIREAEKAFEFGEVPVGAVIVRDGTVLGRAHNLRESLKDPTAHAELVAIREASLRLGGWRLQGATLYVTIEPCPMCAGAIVLARIGKVVYGAKDPRMGAVGSLFNVVEGGLLNHRAVVISGILSEECSKLMRDFFDELRH